MGESNRIPDREPERDERTGSSAPAARIRHQAHWVELQIRQAMERGEFDDLPGRGKPLELGAEHDPDWWLKRLVEREQISVLPPALAIRKEDAELDGRLDRVTTEDGVRRAVAEFNAGVRKAIYTPPVGNQPAPPVITRPRDPDTEVERWTERRTARRAAQRAALAEQRRLEEAERAERRGRWRRLRRRRGQGG